VAAIPDSNGVIYAKKGNGRLKVIDTAEHQSCDLAEKPIQISASRPFGKDTGGAVAGEGAERTLGQVLLTAGDIANGVPAGGQVLLIKDHVALFSLLRTTYGGNGKTTFELLNLKSVAPDHMTYSICDRGIFPRRRD
jgi:hypothetical protein